MIEKDDQTIIRVFANPARNFDCEIYIHKDGMVAEPIVVRKLKERFQRSQAACIIEKRNAQILMDDLWNAGLRPTEGSGSAGSLAATQKHLQDMRTIAFHKLRIQKEITT